MRRIVLLCITSILVLLLVACDLDEIYSNENNSRSTVVTPIEEIEDTEHFLESAIPHILEGELNRKGQAVGFHYAELPTRKGEVIKGTETLEDDNGVYEAKVSVNDVEKQSNQGRSSFFPNSWDSQDVIDAINEAYDSKDYISGNTYEGMTEEGIIVRMYLDHADKIISAFPVYEGD